jgi:disulfide bond formation protein DsbB
VGKSPTLRNILVGILIFIVIILLFSSLGNMVKTIGYILMIVPSQMGFYPLTAAGDIVAVDLGSSPTDLTFIHSGPYQVFADDYDLLNITLQLEQAQGPPWLVVQSRSSGANIPVDYMRRGLSLYDTPYAAGRPIFFLEIPSPGIYQLNHPRRPATIYFVPDETTNYAGTILFSFIVEIALLVGLVLFVYRWRRQAQYARIREIEQRTRERAEQFWKTRKK